ncbi:MAG: HYR domain-containing protein [Bacteroidota bacterium]
MDCSGITSFTATATDEAGNNITINTGNVPGGTCVDVANFSGVYDVGNWLFNNNGGNGTVSLANAPNSIQMIESSSTAANTEFTVNVLEDGVISFSYDYDNTLGGPDDFGYLLNGTYVQLATFSVGTGFQIVAVEAGDVFGFRLEGSGGFLVADVTVSNFQFACQQGAWADFPVGVSQIEYVAVDGSGNRDSCTFYINVKDQQAPSFTNAIADQDLFVDEIDCQNALVPNYVSLGAAQAQDNCAVDSVTQMPAPGSALPLMAIGHDSMFNVVLTAWSNGLSTNDTFKVTIIDNVPPVVTCPNDVTLDADASCQAAINGYPAVNVTDACEVVDLSKVDTTRTDGLATSMPFDYGQTTITYSYTDGGGNTASCSFTVTVQDVTAPMITMIPDATINTSDDGTGNCSSTYTWTPVVSDNCDNAPTVISSPPSGTAFDVGSNPVVVTAIDADGNSSQISFTVTVVDDENPSVYNCPGALTLNSTCANTPVPSINHNVSDNCGPVTVQQIPAAGTPLSSVVLSVDVAPAGLSSGDQYEIKVLGTDPAGRQDSCITTVTIFDNEAPVPEEFPLPDTFYTCSTLVLGPFDAVLCDGTRIQAVANRGTGIGGGQYQFDAPFDEDVVWTYAHPTNGTSFTDIQHITVEDDDTAPTVVCPGDVTVNTAPMACDTSDISGIGMSEASSVLSVGSGEYADTCSSGSDLTVEYALSGATTVARKGGSDAGVETYGKGTTVVTYYVTDAVGNTGSCTFNVTVVDNEAPVLSSNPSDMTVECDNVPDAAVLTATDNCDAVTVGFSESTSAGSCPDNYTITRTWSATDESGNSTAHTQVITVEDTTDPEFLSVNVDGNDESVSSTGLSLTFDNDFGDCGRNVILRVNENNVTDNCTSDGFRFRYSIDGGTPTPYTTVQADASQNFPVGTTMVTFFALDSCGNEGSVDVTVTIVDADEPQVACLNLNRNLPANGPLTVSGIDFINPFGTFDNCTDLADLTIRINGDSTFDCSNIGVNMIDIQVIDEAGNVGSCTATLNIQETFDPVAVCQDITVQLDASGSVTVTGADLDGGSSDNCPGTLSFLINGVSSIDYNCGDVGTFAVTMTVTDQAGNSDDCTAMVTVEDNVAPMAMCADMTVSLDSFGVASIDPEDIDNNSSDACGIASRSLDVSSFDCSNIGANTVVLTVTDNNGNSSTCSATVTVEDNRGPEVMCQDVRVNLEEDGTLKVAASMFDAGSTDNCSPSDSLRFTVNGADTLMLDCMNLGVQSVTITVTDREGNSSTCTANLTVDPFATVEFTAEMRSGPSGSQIDIPVTVNNFWEMRSFQFSVSIADPSVATLDDIIFNINGTTAVTGSGNSRAVSWNTAAPPDGLDLMNGDTAFFVRVTLIGAGGTNTAIVLDGSQITPVASQGCALNEIVTNLSLNDGSATVTAGTSSLISGTITREGDPVRDVLVGLSGTDGSGGTISESVRTDAMGNYSFNVPNGSTVTITPLKDSNVRNGVESVDASIIRTHTASGTPVIMTPYRLIAGDVNLSSGSPAADPNSIDAGIIQNLVAGNFADFSIWGNTSWRFVDAAHVFSDPENPWAGPIPDVINLGPITADALNQNFEGIKNGDVGALRANPQLAIGNTQSQDRSDDQMFLNLQDRELEGGSTYTLEFRTRDFKDLIASQLTLEFDPHYLSFVQFEDGVLGNIVLGDKKANDGQLAVVWAEAFPTQLEEEDVFFRLVFKAVQGGVKLSEVVQLSDAITTTKAFDADLKELDVELEFNQLTSTPELTETTFSLFQNRPNPFRAQTVIGFNLPKASDATLSIFDITGRKVYQYEGSFAQGYNELTISNTELNADGVLYYQLETADRTALRKMTIIK